MPRLRSIAEPPPIATMPSQSLAENASTQSSNIAIVGSPDGFTNRRPAGAAASAAPIAA